jgi:hypothetical protein
VDLRLGIPNFRPEQMRAAFSGRQGVRVGFLRMQISSFIRTGSCGSAACVADDR